MKLGKLGPRHPAGHVRARPRAAGRRPAPPPRDPRVRRLAARASGASTRSTSATSSGSSPSTRAGTRSTARSGRPSATAPTRATASCRWTSSTWRRRSAGPARGCASTRPTGVHRIVAHRTRFYCSKECRWLDESNPGRYTGDRNYLDRYHGWEASEVIQRPRASCAPTARRSIGQPHLRDEHRWTLSDIRAHNLKLHQPQHPRGARARPARPGTGPTCRARTARSRSSAPPAIL